MNQDNIIFQNSQQQLRQKQHIAQKQIRTAFNTFQNLFQSQNLKLPKNYLKDNLNLKKPQQISKSEKQQKIQKDKDLFKRFVSQIIFRTIMQFLSTQDLKQLRLVSIFTNHLIETNIEFLFYHKIQRIKYVESLNIQNFQQPVIPSLMHVQKSLRKLISTSGKISQVPQYLISQLTLLADLYNGSNPQGNKIYQYTTKYDIITTVNISLAVQPLNWYTLLEKDRRLIKNYMSTKINQNDQINLKEFNALTKYVKNLCDFSTRSDYKKICDAYNKDKIIIKLQKQQRFLYNLLLKIKSTTNHLEKISNLGNLFFKVILSYCSMQDIMNTRYVCKKFNQECQQNKNFHYDIQIARVQKQIHQIQSTFHLSLAQDDLFYKTEEQNSLMELFYCIQNQGKLENNISTIDFLQINSQKIADAIFKSEIDHDLYSRSREYIRQRLAMDILVESNYTTFFMKLEKVKECLLEYYVKLPQLQKKLLILLNHYHEPEI